MINLVKIAKNKFDRKKKLSKYWIFTLACDLIPSSKCGTAMRHLKAWHVVPINFVIPFMNEDGFIVMNKIRSFGLAVIFLIIPILGGCQGSPTETPILPGGEILGINLEPADIQLQPGQTTKFKAVGIFPGGVNFDLTEHVEWVSSNPSVAFFLDDGTLVTNVPGDTIINARYEGKNSQSASVHVPGAPPTDPDVPDVAVLRGLRVEPTFAVITEGETHQFECWGRFSDGTEEDYTNLVQWRVSNPEIGFITPAGKYHSVDGFGIITVSAKFSDFESNYAVLTINEAP